MKVERIFFSKTKQLFIYLFVFLSQIVLAQLPADLPWDGVSCANETIILQSGIAAVTCGVTTAVPAAEQWSFGLIDINGTIGGACIIIHLGRWNKLVMYMALL